MKTFLYDRLIEEFGKRVIARTDISSNITDNLNPKFGIRPYQKEAFQRFILYYNESFEGKPNRPHHLLFNMATGSGKTLMMAGLILYLYEKGYRNFLFFVNSTNIIKKTQDNFLNTFSSKYLFNQQLIFDNREVFLKEVQNFESADNENINICFTTIQQLHLDLNNTKEGSLTFEDFKDKKIVLIADEAHHLNTSTKNQGNIFGTWEGTVLEILNQHLDNMLLEFTATLDYESREIADKYADKVIFKYDLAQFRKDGFSKEIDLIRSYYDESQRILQAVILNQYRQELAAKHNINLKPVILFKAKRTIAESELNKEKFHTLIENIDTQAVEAIKETSTVAIVQKAFQFFAENQVSCAQLASRIQANFKPSNCISANNDAEAENNQLILNSLEDENNPVRAVFAVQKLNEGWDVLNLFDIVRLYEDRDGKDGKPGKTTLSEAQLIGRGARYFPFALQVGDDKYTRKYKDKELEILEQLFYHTKEDSRYISEIKKALVDSGIYEDDADMVKRELRLKASFLDTDFYRKGVIFLNKKVAKNYEKVRSFADLGVKKKSIGITLSSGVGKMSAVFDALVEQEMDKMGQKEVQLKDIPTHVVGYALTMNPFFYFDSLRRYFPNLRSSTEFITDAAYLGGLSIIFNGTTKRRNSLTHQDYLRGVCALLTTIETDLKANNTEFEGAEQFSESAIRTIFPKEKTLRINKNDERANGQENIVSDKIWYAHNANYGTTEEKAFVSMFARKFDQWNQKYEKMYLIRNEREVKIFDSKGRAFEPDFVLFAKQKGGKNLTLQVFIEPKGKHLAQEDRWKEDFLMALRAKNQTIEFDTDLYRITGLPFYNSSNENEFKEVMVATLEA